jgi:hypothetical protein
MNKPIFDWEPKKSIIFEPIKFTGTHKPNIVRWFFKQKITFLR